MVPQCKNTRIWNNPNNNRILTNENEVNTVPDPMTQCWRHIGKRLYLNYSLTDPYLQRDLLEKKTESEYQVEYLTASSR